MDVSADGFIEKPCTITELQSIELLIHFKLFHRFSTKLITHLKQEYLAVYSLVRLEQLFQQFGWSIFRSTVWIIVHILVRREGRKIGPSSKSNMATGLRWSTPGCAHADRAFGCVSVAERWLKAMVSSGWLRVWYQVLARRGCGVRMCPVSAMDKKGGYAAGEIQGHCSQPAAEAEAYSLPPGPDVLVGNWLCQLGL